MLMVLREDSVFRDYESGGGERIGRNRDKT